MKGRIEMTDKERILMTIIKRLAITYRSYEPKDSVHFANYIGGFLKDCGLKPNMLVLCMTGVIHDWTIGYTVKKIQDGWVIKELDSNRLCNVSNEAFLPILGLSENQLLVKDEYKFYQKILKAFHKGD